MGDGKWEAARAHCMEMEVEIFWADCLCVKGVWEEK